MGSSFGRRNAISPNRRVGKCSDTGVPTPQQGSRIAVCSHLIVEDAADEVACPLPLR